jgi:hypothetical protein
MMPSQYTARMSLDDAAEMARRVGVRYDTIPIGPPFDAFRASLEAFAQLGTELDPASQRQLDRGKRMTELLKQPQYQPIAFTDQVLSIYAGTRGYLDDVPVPQVLPFERALHAFFHGEYSEIIEELETTGALSDELEAAVRAALDEFKARWKPEAPAAKAAAPAPIAPESDEAEGAESTDADVAAASPVGAAAGGGSPEAGG